EERILAGQLHVFRPSDVLGEVAAVAGPDEAVPRSMQDECGHPNGWQYRSKVSLKVRGLRGDHRSGTHSQPFVAAVPAPEPLIVRDAGSQYVQEATGSPELLGPLEVSRHSVCGEAARVIDVSQMPGAGVDQDQRRRPFGVGRGEEHGHLTAVGMPE